MVIPILKMIHTHSLDPHFYKYGTIIHYLTIPIYEIYFHIKHISPLPPPSLDFLNPTLYFIGRYESAFFDILTILVTYKVGERLFNRKVAFLALIFMVFNPLELFMSHLFKPDTFMTFFAMCVFYYSIRIKEENKIKWYVLAGVFSGFAMSTRLDLFVLFMPITGWFIYYYKNPAPDFTHRQNIRNIGMFLFTAFVAFFLTSPYLILHIPEFIHAIFHEFTYEQDINLENNLLHKRFIAQLIIVFPFMLSISIYALSIYGIYLYTKHKGLYETMLFLIYPFVYFLIITLVSDRPSYAGGGYFYLTILPFFMLLAAYSFMYVFDKLRKKSVKILIVMVIFIDILFSSGNFISLIYNYNRLGYWVNKNIPPDSTILILTTLRPVFKWKYYVYPIYTEAIKRNPPIRYSVKVVKPDFVIATGFDIHLEGGYDYFNQLMNDDHFHQVKIFMPYCAPYISLFSKFTPEVKSGEIYVYKSH
ncbi:MAG: glycosyltransferase family 39 protein [Deltaproteobacteria bacterium]|nr:glycosyltransferase family 39 protein [Deltaproteobacteria bacterium]